MSVASQIELGTVDLWPSRKVAVTTRETTVVHVNVMGQQKQVGVNWSSYVAQCYTTPTCCNADLAAAIYLLVDRASNVFGSVACGFVIHR